MKENIPVKKEDKMLNAVNSVPLNSSKKSPDGAKHGISLKQKLDLKVYLQLVSSGHSIEIIVVTSMSIYL